MIRVVTTPPRPAKKLRILAGLNGPSEDRHLVDSQDLDALILASVSSIRRRQAEEGTCRNRWCIRVKGESARG